MNEPRPRVFVYMTFTHTQASRFLDALVDQELDELTREAFSSHVDECQDCHRAFLLTCRIKNSLAKLAALTEPGLEAWIGTERRRSWKRRVPFRHG
ncbi:MAG: zf-HC2 domain-containing protein [Actinobacteria bacterium]|nr:zf-HC2 domain-containing protein [Actinomycetota bacterium]